MTFESVNTLGAISFESPKNIEVAVLSAFAGTYIVTESYHFRSGTDQNISWNNEKRFIGSVNDTTFSHPEFMGRFSYADSTDQFVFYLDESDNTITVPTSVGGVPQPIIFGEYMITCDDTGVNGDMSNANGDNSNILIPDFVTGKHIIKLSYGLYASHGTIAIGSREFYETL